MFSVRAFLTAYRGTMITDDDLDTHLRNADAARSFTANDQTLDVLLHSSEEAAGVLPRSRQRRRTVAGFGIAGVVVIGAAFAAPAAADVFRFLAETDWKCSYGTECGDPEAQWIDTSASDLPAYVASVFPENLPFAAPLTEQLAIAQVTNVLAATPALTSEVSVQRLYEQTAYCSWVGQWLDSDSTGNVEAREKATEVLRESASWPAMRPLTAAESWRCRLSSLPWLKPATVTESKRRQR